METSVCRRCRFRPSAKSTASPSAGTPSLSAVYKRGEKEKGGGGVLVKRERGSQQHKTRQTTAVITSWRLTVDERSVESEVTRPDDTTGPVPDDRVDSEASGKSRRRCSFESRASPAHGQRNVR